MSGLRYNNCWSTLTPPPMVHDWVNKGFGISNCICATGHIKVPLIKNSRASCPGGRFPPSFVHQAIIITQ